MAEVRVAGEVAFDPGDIDGFDLHDKFHATIDNLAHPTTPSEQPATPSDTPSNSV